MPFKVIEEIKNDPHQWTVLHSQCDLSDENDKLLALTVDILRSCYGEDELAKRAEAYNKKEITVDPSVAETFNVEAIIKAFRRGLPDPSKEGNKPEQLKNSRSEPAELIARAVLQKIHGVIFPAAPQRGKCNPNMPILGFDGWGLCPLKKEENSKAFLLIQVKASDDKKGSAADVLVTECKELVNNIDGICRAISNLALAVEPGTEIENSLFRMLETIGEDRLPELVVAPSIVRGVVAACAKDLEPLIIAHQDFMPAISRSLSVSINTDLNEFGEKVMYRARSSK